MAIETTSQSTSTSRRALLAGAVAGIGALAATALGRPASARGADGDPVVLGTTNSADHITAIQRTGTGDALSVHSGTDYYARAITGSSPNGTGVYGTSPGNVGVRGNSITGSGVHGDSESGHAVSGISDSSTGVHGQSTSGIGVHGQTDATNAPGVMGVAFGNNSGVVGSSGYAVSGKPETGVYGVATQGTNGKGVFGESFNGKGVFGESPNGRGIQGKTTSGYAGYFEGKVYTTAFFELNQIAAPAAPGTNRARLFLDDTGSTQRLRIRFGNGVIKTIATDA